jgi:hypothetical protein
MSTINPEFTLPPRAATNTVTSASSTAAIALVENGFFWFVARTADCWILFGNADVAEASASNGFNLPLGVPVPFYCPPGYASHFRVIASAAGTLSWYKSGP